MRAAASVNGANLGEAPCSRAARQRAGAGKAGTIKAITERVMGFCTAEQARRFLPVVPLFERMMVSSGIILLKGVPYTDVPAAKVKLPKRRIGRYQAVDIPFKYVPERF